MSQSDGSPQQLPDEQPTDPFPIRWIVGPALVLPFVGVAFVILVFPFHLGPGRGGQQDWSLRMHLDIARVLLAADSFEEATGRYPSFLAEMVQPAGQLAYGLARLRDMYGQAFRYEVVDGVPHLAFEGDYGKWERWSLDDVPKSVLARVKSTPPRFPNAFRPLNETAAKEALELLASDVPATSWQGASVLWQAGRSAVACIPDLAALVVDGDAPAEARYAASYALVEIGRWDYRPAVDALLVALDSEEAQLRWYALTALEQMGPAATPAVEPIADALQDSDDGVRQAAAQALAAIGVGARSEVAALKDGRTGAGTILQTKIDGALERILGPNLEPSDEDP